MKARLEETSVQYRGVVLVSETEEEKRILWDIWNSKGAPVSVGRLDGSVELVIAPTPEEKVKENPVEFKHGPERIRDQQVR